MTDWRKEAQRARDAARIVATLTTDAKNAVLSDLADKIDAERKPLLAANAEDMDAARELPDAKRKRLLLSEGAITQMVDGLRQIVALGDPVGAVASETNVPSGLRVRRVRCPLGVIMMIYEARPNVTIDAFALCFKAGNACILKCGREALRSSQALAQLARAALARHQAPEAALTLLTTSDREEIKTLLRLSDLIDLVIPRGGETLVRFVHEHARMPVVAHFHGVCHVYVDQAADLEQAQRICLTGKTSAPATCNATEAVLIHADIAPKLVPALVAAYAQAGVEMVGDATVCGLAGPVAPAAPDDWGREFLAMKVALRVVKNMDEAIAHIERYGSNHTEAIVSSDAVAITNFQRRVQASCVLANASTRFNDGYQLGLGAEIGISTSRIHAYGPMGLNELTTTRFIVDGEGQCR